MFRLWRAQARREFLAVTAPLAATMVSAVFVQLSLFFLLGARSPEVELQLESSSTAGSFRGFIVVITTYLIAIGVGIPVVATQLALGRLSVGMRMQVIGQWRMLGATSGQILRVIFGELLAVTVIGAALAVLLAIPLSEPATALVMSMTDFGISVRPDVSPVALVLSLAIMLFLSAFGALGTARIATRVSPVAARRELPRKESRKRRFLSVIASSACLIGAGATGASFLAGPAPAPGTNLLLMNALIVSAAVIAGSRLLRPIISWVARPLRSSRSAGMFLAGQFSEDRIRVSPVVVLAPYVGAALLGGFISGSQTFARAQGLEPDSSGLLQGLVFYGPAAAIGLVGAATALLLRGRPDSRAQALLESAGAGRRALLAVPVLEALVYLAVTVVLTGITIAVPVMLYAASLARAGSSAVPVVSVVPPATFLAVAFCVVAVVLFVPVWKARKRSVRELLQRTA